MSLRLAANILAIAGCGVFSGMMLTIGLTLGAYWKELPPAEFVEWFSTNNHLIARTIPLAIVPILVGLAGSIAFAEAGTRPLWWGALAAIFALLVITAVFHLPANASFAGGKMPLDAVGPLLDRWLWLHAARILLGLSATVLGIVALTR
jgi:hypothetical protein